MPTARSILATLEDVPGLSALPWAWKKMTGEQFPELKILCLEAAPQLALSYPCPRHCGCHHHIVARHDRTEAIAICRCDPPNCPDFPVSIEEATPLRVNRPRLGRAICRALGCSSRPADLAIPEASQIGSWSADAVPIVLAIEGAPAAFRLIVAELAARLSHPFILLAPSADLVDAHCHELLSHTKAGFFALENIFTLSPSGTLLPKTAPGELLTKFTPQPKDVDESAARQAFALVRALDAEAGTKPPTPLTVFAAYCIDGQNLSEIAKRCRCSRPTVRQRLGLIRQKTGVDPNHFRAVSAHLSSVGDSFSDARARHIHRAGLTDDSESSPSDS